MRTSASQGPGPDAAEAAPTGAWPSWTATLYARPGPCTRTARCSCAGASASEPPPPTCCSSIAGGTSIAGVTPGAPAGATPAQAADSFCAPFAEQSSHDFPSRSSLEAPGERLHAPPVVSMTRTHRQARPAAPQRTRARSVVTVTDMGAHRRRPPPWAHTGGARRRGGLVLHAADVQPHLRARAPTQSHRRACGHRLHAQVPELAHAGHPASLCATGGGQWPGASAALPGRPAIAW